MAACYTCMLAPAALLRKAGHALKTALHHTAALCLQGGDHVSSLDVSDNNLSADASNIGAQLPQLSALKALLMNNCSLTSWPLESLGAGSMQALQTLELCGNSFGSGIPQQGLAACPRLKCLDLSGKV